MKFEVLGIILFCMKFAFISGTPPKVAVKSMQDNKYDIVSL